MLPSFFLFSSPSGLVGGTLLITTHFHFHAFHRVTLTNNCNFPGLAVETYSHSEWRFWNSLRYLLGSESWKRSETGQTGPNFTVFEPIVFIIFNKFKFKFIRFETSCCAQEHNWLSAIWPFCYVEGITFIMKLCLCVEEALNRRCKVTSQSTPCSISPTLNQRLFKPW